MESTNEITAIALSWPDKARGIKIESVGTYTLAGDMLKSLRGLRNEVKAAFDPVVKAAHEAHKTALAQKAKADKPLDEAEQIIMRGMTKWTQDQERIRRQEEERLREEARREEEERRLRMAITAEKEGDAKLADKILDEPFYEDAIVLPTSVPKVEGVSYRDVWKFRIVNQDIIPREYLVVDEQKLGALARSMKGSMRIPGVEFFSEKSTAVRG